MRIFQEKCCREIPDGNFMSDIFSPPKIMPLYFEIMWKKKTEGIPAFPLLWLRERVTMLRYTHIACLVTAIISNHFKVPMSFHF